MKTTDKSLKLECKRLFLTSFMEGSLSALVWGRTLPITFQLLAASARARLRPIPRFAPQLCQYNADLEMFVPFMPTNKKNGSIHDVWRQLVMLRDRGYELGWVRQEGNNLGQAMMSRQK